MSDSDDKGGRGIGVKILMAAGAGGVGLCVTFFTPYFHKRGAEFAGQPPPAAEAKAPAVVVNQTPVNASASELATKDGPVIGEQTQPASSPRHGKDTNPQSADSVPVPQQKAKTPPREPRVIRNEITVPRFANTAQIEYLESQGYGRATDRETAVFKALEEAVSKQGATLSAEIKLKLEAETKRFNETKTRRVEQSVSSNCTRATDGLLRWWDIKSETEEAGTYTVEVAAVVAKIKTPAAANSTRKTLAVLPFRVSEDPRIKGRSVPASTIGTQLREAAVTYLVQSRKFVVLDKTFDDELTRLADTKPTSDPIQRAIEAAKRIGAQYVVIGLAEGLGVSLQSIGGLSVASADGAVSLRIIEIQSRQTVLAKAFLLRDLPDLDLGTDRSELSIADALGRAMAERTLETIYPFKVAALNGPDEVVLNRGGDALSAGDKLELFNPGEEIKDPSTGESLGVTERKVANVEVTRVLPKVSYAKVINKTEDILVEAICRKSQQSNTEAKNKPAGIRNAIDNLFK
jgi:hypothetical protein